MSIFRLFGPPDVEKLKANNDVKNLIKALSYRKDDIVRRDAAEALNQVTKLQVSKIIAKSSYTETAKHVEKKWPDPDPKIAAEALKESVVAGKTLMIILENAPSFVTEDNLHEIARLDNIKKITPFITDCLYFSKPDDEVTILFDSSLLKQLARQELFQREQELLQRKISRKLNHIEELKVAGDVRGLIKMIDEEKEVQVYEAAANALKQIRTPQAVELMVAALKNQNGDVRFAAAVALGHIRDVQAMEPLIAVLTDQDHRVQQTATQSLEQIDPDWRRSEVARKTVPMLVAALKNQNGDVRFAAAVALGHIRDVQAMEPLIAVLTDQDHRVQQTATQSLEQIDPDWRRSEVARKTVPMFVAALNDKDIGVRLSAVDVLGQISDPKTVGPLISLLKDEDNEWYIQQAVAGVLGQIGDSKAVEPLLELLKDKDRKLRQAAAEALGQIGDPGAVDPLVATLNDTNKQVRREAANALDSLGWQPTDDTLRVLYTKARNG